MADFLANVNLQEPSPSQPDNQPCGSIDELHARLHSLLRTKVTATRAEHVATNLDLAGTAELTLGLSDGENDVLEGLSNIDPSLGGFQSVSVAAERPGEQAARVVHASDALANQPHDDPVLQRSVAKYIITAVSAMDGSEWTVREVSRGAQGWTFVYICKGSFQHWRRQNKAQTKVLIAEYSQRELDPLLSCRPAFDCRGSVTISFPPSSGAISIRYSHTPLHKTVSQLLAFFKPAPERHPLPVIGKQKTPKKPSSARKKRNTDKTQDANGRPRKRKRTTGDGNLQEGSSISQLAEPLQPSDPSHIASQDPPEAVRTNDKEQDVNQELQSLVDIDSTAQQSQARQEAIQPSELGGVLPINVSPEEAARRRDFAIVTLREAGVDPDSLSPEQFNIFANQSPELQKESLNMLVKYGAERLRIVHPGNRENSASSSAPTPAATTSDQSGIQASSSDPVSINEPVIQTQEAEIGKKTNKRNSVANGAYKRAVAAAKAEAGEQTEAPKKSRRRGGGKSRVACFQCKQRKVKCPHEKPTCVECQTAGLICEYPPPKPRTTKSKEVITAEDEQEDNPPEDRPEAELEAQPQQEEGEAEKYSEMQDNSVHHQMPVTDMLTANINVNADWGTNDAQSNYFQQPSNLAVTESSPSHQSHASASNLMFPQGQLYYPAPVSTGEMHQESMTQTMSPKSSKYAMSGTATDVRQSMLSRSLQGEGQQSPSMDSLTTADWPSSGNPVTQSATAIVMASSTTQDQSPGEQNYGVASPEARHGAWRAAALSQTETDGAQQPSMATAPIQRHGTVSPMNDVAQHKPQHDKHASRSSLHEASVAETLGAPAPLDSDQQPAHHVSTRHMTTSMNATQGYNGYGRYSDSRTTNGVAAANRITYEPYSFQRDTSTAAPSYASYGHGSQATTTASMPTLTPTAMASPDQPSTRPYDSCSSPQHSRNAASHTDATSYAGSGTSALDPTSDQPRASRQNFSIRPPSRSSQASTNPERSYSPCPPHLQQQQHHHQHHQQHAGQPLPQQPQQHQHNQQQTSQHHGWYNFNNQGNNSYSSSANQGSNYSWSMPGEP